MGDVTHPAAGTAESSSRIMTEVRHDAGEATLTERREYHL